MIWKTNFAACWRLLGAASLTIGLSYCNKASAQDVFTPSGFHRDIPEYVDGLTLWRGDSQEDLLVLKERLHKERKSVNENDVVRTLSKLGASSDFANDFYGAERYHSEALSIAQRIYPEDSVNVAAVFHNSGANLEFQKRYDDAIKAYGKAMGIWRLQKPEDKVKVAIEYFAIGRCFGLMGSSEPAAALMKGALKLARETSSDSLRFQILQELTPVLHDLKDPDVAKYESELDEVFKLKMEKPGVKGGKAGKD